MPQSIWKRDKIIFRTIIRFTRRQELNQHLVLCWLTMIIKVPASSKFCHNISIPDGQFIVTWDVNVSSISSSYCAQDSSQDLLTARNQSIHLAPSVAQTTPRFLSCYKKTCSASKCQDDYCDWRHYGIWICMNYFERFSFRISILILLTPKAPKKFFAIRT